MSTPSLQCKCPDWIIWEWIPQKWESLCNNLQKRRATPSLPFFAPWQNNTEAYWVLPSFWHWQALSWFQLHNMHQLGSDMDNMHSQINLQVPHWGAWPSGDGKLPYHSHTQGKYLNQEYVTKPLETLKTKSKAQPNMLQITHEFAYLLHQHS